MKGTVIEYVDNEVQQLTNERDSLQKAEKMLEDITEFFGDFKLDSFEMLMNLAGAQDNSNEEDKKRFQNSRRKLMTASTMNLSTPVGQSKQTRASAIHSSISDRGNLLSLPNRISMSRSMSSIPTTYQTERAKKEKYREELLEQIRDKKHRKEVQHQIDNEIDAEIERKVSRQRLMMYMDQLAERERGEFITKNHRKISAKKVQLASYIPVNDCTRIQSSKSKNRSIPNSQHPHKPSTDEPRIDDNAQKQNKEKESSQKAKEKMTEYGRLETNILSNLNEVRKIMQCDHIEMLEQLLNK